MSRHDQRHGRHPRFHRPQRRFALENLPELIAQEGGPAEDRPAFVSGDEVLRMLAAPVQDNSSLPRNAVEEREQ